MPRNKIFPSTESQCRRNGASARLARAALFFPPSATPFLLFSLFFAPRRTRCIFKFCRAITLSWNQGVVPATGKSCPCPASFITRDTFFSFCLTFLVILLHFSCFYHFSSLSFLHRYWFYSFWFIAEEYFDIQYREQFETSLYNHSYHEIYVCTVYFSNVI